MTMTADRFAGGLTYDDYKAAMSRNRDRLEDNERRVVLDNEALGFFRALPRPLRVVALAEDWCGDVLANLPVVAVLARAAGTLDLRIFYRDQNLDLMGRWLSQGKYQSIPVFAFFDEGFHELGHWIERPASVAELRAARRREVFASDPAFGSPDAPVDGLPVDVRVRLQAALQRMREETVPFANAEVQRELRDLVAAALPVR